MQDIGHNVLVVIKVLIVPEVSSVVLLRKDLLPSSFSCWQNSFTFGCETEDFNFLPVVGWRPEATRGHL